MKLPVEEARGIIWGDTDRFAIISDDVWGNSRWSINHRLTIKDVVDGKFYQSEYSVGATESQDESPWEYDNEDGMADFIEVEPVETVVIKYVPVKTA